jgi:catalase
MMNVSRGERPRQTEITPVKPLDQVHITAPISFASRASDKDFEQATALWRVMSKQDGARPRFVNNVAAHVSDVKEKWIREEVYGMVSQPWCLAKI